MCNIELTTLTQNNINKAEHAIKTKLIDIEKNYTLSISIQYYNCAIYGYKLMVKDDTPVTSYCMFAFNAGGMQTYGFYKSINGKIYIIDSFLGDIDSVYIPYKNIDCLNSIL